jgi:hypothetical protein
MTGTRCSPPLLEVFLEWVLIFVVVVLVVGIVVVGIVVVGLVVVGIVVVGIVVVGIVVVGIVVVVGNHRVHQLAALMRPGGHLLGWGLGVVHLVVLVVEREGLWVLMVLLLIVGFVVGHLLGWVLGVLGVLHLVEPEGMYLTHLFDQMMVEDKQVEEEDKQVEVKVEQMIFGVDMVYQHLLDQVVEEQMMFVVEMVKQVIFGFDMVYYDQMAEVLGFYVNDLDLEAFLQCQYKMSLIIYD